MRTLRDVPDGVVERYLQSLVAHDWDGLAGCLADDFVRIGPFGDTYPSKSEYLAFISALMPRLPDYSMEITRVTYADAVAYAELNETMTVDGVSVRTPECLSFELAGSGQIARVEIFIQTAPPRSWSP